MKRLTQYIALLAVLAVSFTGCEKNDDAGAGGEHPAKHNAAKANSPKKADSKKAAAKQRGAVRFELIPAKTPYAFVGLEPIPNDVIDKMKLAFAPLIDKGISEIQGELSKGGDSKEAQLGKALLDAMGGELSEAGLKKLGINTRPRFALYGVGLLPTLRIELLDGKKLKGHIESFAKILGETLPVRKAGGVAYWGKDKDEMTVFVAIVDNELIAGITPQNAAAKTLPMIFGAKAPAASLMAAGTLQKLQKANGFNSFGLGLIDLTVIADTLLGDAKGTNAEVWTALGAPIPPMDAVCKTEIRSLVDHAPRMVFGYTELTAKKFSAKYIVELNQQLAAGLQKLSAPVPGLGEDTHAVATFGMGVNVTNAIEFAKAQIKHMKANPFKCAQLADFNGAVMGGEMALNQPLPPFVANISGFNLIVKSGDFSGMIPTKLKGNLIIAVKQPDQLVGLAKAAVPALANLALKPDGVPVALPAEMSAPGIDSPFIAMNQNGIAASIGAGEEKGLTALLNKKGLPNAPLLSVTYDMKVLMQSFMKMQGMGGGAEEMAMLEGMAKIFGVTNYQIAFTKAGIEFRQTIHLN